MTGNKTVANTISATKYIKSLQDERKQKDSLALLELMQDVTGKKPKMWGDSIIGFGSYHYKYASGREGDWFLTGFSPRKDKISIYILPDLDSHTQLLSRLGKHKTGKCCVYVRSVEDIDQAVLRELIRRSLDRLKNLYG